MTTDIKDLRREYGLGKLSKQDLDPNPFKQFELWLDQAITSRQFVDASAATLSTVDKTLTPTNRIVLLKALTSEAFRFFTNYTSSKAQDIAANPNVCLSFAWLQLERQVIIRGRAKKTDELISNEYFASRPLESNLGALASEQSSVISDRSVLDKRLETLMSKYQDQMPERPDFWGGYDIVPQEIEFWQGGRSRLHDRLVYRKQGNEWIIERRAP